MFYFRKIINFVEVVTPSRIIFLEQHTSQVFYSLYNVTVDVVRADVLRNIHSSKLIS